MATVAELKTCDGFAVEAPDRLLGWVEETWLDRGDHPAALAIRTPDGRRGLLLAETVTAVDPDSQEVLVPTGAALQELDAPRLERSNGSVVASWRTTGATVGPRASAAEESPLPALAAARMSTAHAQRPLWHTLGFALAALVTLVCLEIGAAFLVAYLVTGYPPY
jgi:hypothetical protein